MTWQFHQAWSLFIFELFFQNILHFLKRKFWPTVKCIYAILQLHLQFCNQNFFHIECWPPIFAIFHTQFCPKKLLFSEKKISESHQQSNFVLDMICGPSHNSWELNPFKSFSNIYWIKDDINIFCCLLFHNFPDCI